MIVVIEVFTEQRTLLIFNVSSRNTFYVLECIAFFAGRGQTRAIIESLTCLLPM
jgi:hypothetical protein